jgi:hypothetical protein
MKEISMERKQKYTSTKVVEIKNKKNKKRIQNLNFI